MLAWCMNSIARPRTPKNRSCSEWLLGFEPTAQEIKPFLMVIIMMTIMKQGDTVRLKSGQEATNCSIPQQQTEKCTLTYLAAPQAACLFQWTQPVHLQGHIYCPQVPPGRCPRNMSWSVCTCTPATSIQAHSSSGRTVAAVEVPSKWGCWPQMHQQQLGCQWNFDYLSFFFLVTLEMTQLSYQHFHYIGGDSVIDKKQIGIVGDWWQVALLVRKSNKN